MVTITDRFQWRTGKPLHQVDLHFSDKLVVFTILCQFFMIA